MSKQAILQQVDAADFPALKTAARTSIRRRTNLNFHSGPDDPVQRMLNVICADSYVTPHRHVTPLKSESFLILEGLAGIVLFDGDGRVRETLRLGGAGNPLGADIPAGHWHAVLALSETVVLYEVKAGPYDPVADKEMAPWAPKEGDLATAAYLKKLQQHFG